MAARQANVRRWTGMLVVVAQRAFCAAPGDADERDCAEPLLLDALVDARATVLGAHRQRSEHGAGMCC